MKKFLGRTFDPDTQTYRFSDNSAPPITAEQKYIWDGLSGLDRWVLLFSGKGTLGRAVAAIGREPDEPR